MNPPHIHVLGVGAIGSLLSSHLLLLPPSIRPTVTLLIRSRHHLTSILNPSVFSSPQSPYSFPSPFPPFPPLPPPRVSIKLERNGTVTTVDGFRVGFAPSLREELGDDEFLKQVDQGKRYRMRRLRGAGWDAAHVRGDKTKHLGLTRPRFIRFIEEQDYPENSDSSSNHISILILTVRSQSLVTALRPLLSRLSSESTIILLQNGMGQLDEICKELWPFEDSWNGRPNFLVGFTSNAAYIKSKGREEMGGSLEKNERQLKQRNKLYGKAEEDADEGDDAHEVKDSDQVEESNESDKDSPPQVNPQDPWFLSPLDRHRRSIHVVQTGSGELNFFALPNSSSIDLLSSWWESLKRSYPSKFFGSNPIIDPSSATDPTLSHLPPPKSLKPTSTLLSLTQATHTLLALTPLGPKMLNQQTYKVKSFQKLVVNVCINSLTAIMDCMNGELVGMEDVEWVVERVCQESEEVFAVWERGENSSGGFEKEKLPPSHPLSAVSLKELVFKVATRTASNFSSTLTEILSLEQHPNSLRYKRPPSLSSAFTSFPNATTPSTRGLDRSPPKLTDAPKIGREYDPKTFLELPYMTGYLIELGKKFGKEMKSVEALERLVWLRVEMAVKRIKNRVDVMPSVPNSSTIAHSSSTPSPATSTSSSTSGPSSPTLVLRPHSPSIISSRASSGSQIASSKSHFLSRLREARDYPKHNSWTRRGRFPPRFPKSPDGIKLIVRSLEMRLNKEEERKRMREEMKKL